MSLGQKLINRTGALARKIKRLAPSFEDINEQPRVLARAVGSQKLILSAQRQTDQSGIGLAVLAEKIEVRRLLALGVDLSVMADGIETITAIADTGVAQGQTITTVADVGGSLNSKWFSISAIDATTKVQKNFYVWFNDGSGTDPAPAGKTGIEVSYSSGASANTLAGLLATALAALSGDFASAVATGAAVAITNAKPGSVPAAADGTAPTGFTFGALSPAGVNSNLNNTYFFLNSGGNADKYYVWMNVSGLGTDPAPVGLTAIPIAFNGGSSASTIAGDMATAITAANSGADFSAVATGPSVAVTNLNDQPYTPASDHNTGFSFSDSGYNLQAELTNLGLPEIVRYQAYADAPSGIHQVETIGCLADNDGSLNNHYFEIDSANGDNQYYVWFNVAGGGIDPMVANKTSLMVSIYANAPASVVASAVAAVLTAADSGADFSASATGSVVTVTMVAVGPADGAMDPGRPLNANSLSVDYIASNLPSSFATGFAFAITTLGQLALSLAGKYFVLYDSNGSVAVWYNVGGSGSAPGGYNRTLEVSVASLASASTVASATAAVLAGDSSFTPSNSNGSMINAVSSELGRFGTPSNGTSTFPLSEAQTGTINAQNLLQIKQYDLAEVKSGQLAGQFFTIASVEGNIVNFVQTVPGYAGESNISLLFQMRTTIPEALNDQNYQGYQD
jgi:hypothetical protein